MMSKPILHEISDRQLVKFFVTLLLVRLILLVCPKNFFESFLIKFIEFNFKNDAFAVVIECLYIIV